MIRIHEYLSYCCLYRDNIFIFVPASRHSPRCGVDMWFGSTCPSYKFSDQTVIVISKRKTYDIDYWRRAPKICDRFEYNNILI